MEKMAHFLSLKIAKVGRLNFKLQTLIGIIVLASILRLYRISDYMTFLGDEGRDVLVVKKILEGNFTLLGPRASAGDFFLGPIYYYLIAPFLWLFRFDPVGPAVMVALIAVATVFLIYKFTKELIDEKAALFAAALYAVSPLVIAYSRSSWNPNPMPFVSLLTLYLSYKAVKKPSLKIFLLIGVLLGVAIQLHYLATFLILIVGAFILVGNFYRKKLLIETLKNYVQILIGFLIGFSPFLAFEIRHGFPNTRTIINFIFSTTTQSTYSNYGYFTEVIGDVLFRIFGRLVFRFPPPEQFIFFEKTTIDYWKLAIIVLIILSAVLLFKIKNKLAFYLLSTWLFLGILLFGFYKKPIYDYYFGFMFPLPFILTGNFLSKIFDSQKFSLLSKSVALTIFFAIFIFNLNGSPFRFEPNRQKDQVRLISEFVLSKTGDKPFNFALITPGNSDHAYRYYFEVLGRSDVRMENLIKDPQRKTVTDQLMVVCEGPDCHPLGHPLFEISNFGRAEIVGEWTVSVVKVFKLVHYRGG